VSDDLSRSVCVSALLPKVVSTAPNLTEIVFALNAGGLLAGRSTNCNRPPEARQIGDIGAYMNPDPERILSSQPQLVLATRENVRKELVQRLERLGIPVFVTVSDDLVDIFDLIRRLGVLLGRETEAQTLVEHLRTRREALRHRLAGTEKPSVLFAVGIRPLVVAGGKSFIGSLIRDAGGANIAESAPIAFPKFSIEEVIRKDPQIILLLDKECPDRNECVKDWARYPGLTAVKTGRIHALDADLMARPSPAIIEALEKLADLIHPVVADEALNKADSQSGR
jgi:iron complex transport system substrate-binding protein